MGCLTASGGDFIVGTVVFEHPNIRELAAFIYDRGHRRGEAQASKFRWSENEAIGPPHPAGHALSAERILNMPEVHWA